MKLTTPNDFQGKSDKERLIEAIEKNLKEGGSTYIGLAIGYEIPWCYEKYLDEVIEDYKKAGWSDVKKSWGQLGTLLQLTFIK